MSMGSSYNKIFLNGGVHITRFLRGCFLPLVFVACNWGVGLHNFCGHLVNKVINVIYFNRMDNFGGPKGLFQIKSKYLIIANSQMVNHISYIIHIILQTS